MSITQAVVSFLIFMNPIALFLYLTPLNKQSNFKQFVNIVLRATLIALVIYLVFALTGEKLFQVLGVSFNAFRIFGGVVVASLSLIFIIQGKRSFISTTGELNKIAAEIALPFMVGAGSITFSIILGRRMGGAGAALAVVIVMLLTFLIIIGLAAVRRVLNKKHKAVFDQNADILLRINSFIIGAIGVDLVVIGLRNLQ